MKATEQVKCRGITVAKWEGDAMKTLDEVIKALEECTADDAIESEGVYLATDSLHYLKEYRTTQTAYIKAMADYEELKNFWAESQENPELTWDELKTMEGKPVWITWTVKGEWHHGDWNLVNAQLGDSVWLVDGNGEEFDLLKEYQGTMWQAYRKER